MDYVEYVDSSNHSGALGFFRKLDTYRYQNEWRVVMHSNSKDALEIYLGSLSDIALRPLNEEDFYNISTEYWFDPGISHDYHLYGIHQEYDNV